MKTIATTPASRRPPASAAILILAALLLFLCLSDSVPAAQAAGSSSASFSMAPYGELQLTLPAGWKGRTKRSPRNLSPTIEISSTAGEEFVVLVTPVHPSTRQSVSANLKAATETAAQAAVAQSVEKKADIKPLKGEQTDGYYFSLTDSAPAPGEYKYMSQGLARIRELLVQFTILSNDPAQKIRDTALGMLRTARHEQAALTTLDIPVSGQGWKIRVFDPGLGALQQRAEAGQFQCRTATGTGFNLSLFVEKPGSAGTQHGDVFDHYWPRSKRNPLIEEDSIKVERSPKFVKVSYRVGPMPNVNYYFAYKGRWVDVHISKLPFAKDDEKLFASFDQLLAYSE